MNELLEEYQKAKAEGRTEVSFEVYAEFRMTHDAEGRHLPDEHQRICTSCGQVDNPECNNVIHTINNYRKDDENEQRFQEARRRHELEEGRE